MAAVDLSRFLDLRGDFDRALMEVGQGRKRSHWMWYVFPQLAGLGTSSMAQRYAIGGIDEAGAFLLDPVLGRNYQQIVDEVWHQVVELDVSIHDLFGSPDDSKLVSSLTLFVGVAQGLLPPEPSLAEFIGRASGVLEVAAAQGLPGCESTTAFLAGRP